MEVYSQKQERQEYIKAQVRRSNIKFSYCKVFYKDVVRYHNILLEDIKASGKGLKGPILCLGTRSGREIDLFRIRFAGQGLLRVFFGWLELNLRKFRPLLLLIESIGRSDINNISEKSVVGVEVNPSASREDTWIGSFDEMPKEWGQKFNILYSNSFDHSFDAKKTAQEWLRVIKPGGYLILGTIKESTPSRTDRISDITLNDILSLFPGKLVFSKNEGSVAGYTETIIRIAG